MGGMYIIFKILSDNFRLVKMSDEKVESLNLHSNAVKGYSSEEMDKVRKSTVNTHEINWNKWGFQVGFYFDNDFADNARKYILLSQRVDFKIESELNFTRPGRAFSNIKFKKLNVTRGDLLKTLKTLQSTNKVVKVMLNLKNTTVKMSLDKFVDMAENGISMFVTLFCISKDTTCLFEVNMCTYRKDSKWQFH